MNKNEILLDIIREQVRKEIEEENAIKNKGKDVNLFESFEGNTYVNIDMYLGSVKNYFGLDSDSLKRELYKNGVLYHNGSKYIPNEDFESIVIMKNKKLYVNRDEIDKYLMIYLLERMSIKNIKDTFEYQMENNKSELISELYRVSNAEFQRKSPVFQDLRLGENKTTKIDM